MNTQYFFGPFPALDLGEIVLREILATDAEDYLDYMNRDEMEGFLTKENRPQTIEKALGTL